MLFLLDVLSGFIVLSDFVVLFLLDLLSGFIVLSGFVVLFSLILRFFFPASRV